MKISRRIIMSTKLPPLSVLKEMAGEGVELNDEVLDAVAGGAYTVEEWNAMSPEERKEAQKRSKDEIVVVNLSGRGDKDVETVLAYLEEAYAAHLLSIDNPKFLYYNSCMRNSCACNYYFLEVKHNVGSLIATLLYYLHLLYTILY